MKSQFIRPILLVGIIGSVSFEAAVAQRIEHSDSKAAQDHIERISKAIPCVEDLEKNASHQILALIATVEMGKHQESEWAIRALAAMQSKASPAVAAICKKMSDPDHATRSAAVDALAAIGDTAVGPLRKLLGSPNAKARASATQALGRLKRLDFGDATRLSSDSDPRVRAASADGLSRLGRPGVPRLADMLQDSELAVAVEAARALNSNREDPSIAIPKLIQALSRVNLSSAAGDALSAYGIAAQRAVPALNKAHLEEALQHIGPPSDLDVPQLCESLMDEDPKTRILSAKSLALLGLGGKSASVALEAAADKSIQQYVEQKRSAKSQSPQQSYNSGRVFVASEECATAVWEVTHDMRRFLNLIRRLAIAADRPIFCTRSEGSEHISADDCRPIEAMLRHSNRNVQETALNVLAKAGATAEPLKKVLIQMAQSPIAELSQKAIETLAAVGASVGREVEPVLTSKLRDRTISLRQFADTAGSLVFRSDATQAILERGLRDNDESTAYYCARALCITSNEPSRIARLVTDASRDKFFDGRGAISALNGLRNADDVVLPFLVEQLQSDDFWTRRDALNAIGLLGEKASAMITLVERVWDDQLALIRLKAAKAILLVTNNPDDLEKQLEIAFASDDPADRFDAIETIGELNRAGARFVDYVLTDLRTSPPDGAETAIKALQAIGTEKAVAALRETAQSQDWMLRSQSIEALRNVGNPNGPGGN